MMQALTVAAGVFFLWLFVVGPLVVWIHDTIKWNKRKHEYEERRAREQRESPDATAP